MNIKVKARLKREGHTTKNRILAEQAEAICATAAETKVPWRLGKKYVMTVDKQYAWGNVQYTCGECTNKQIP